VTADQYISFSLHQLSDYSLTRLIILFGTNSLLVDLDMHVSPGQIDPSIGGCINAIVFGNSVRPSMLP
jgi:hypothetical protein